MLTNTSLFAIVPFDVFVALLLSSLFFLAQGALRRQEVISDFSQASTWRSQCNYLWWSMGCSREVGETPDGI